MSTNVYEFRHSISNARTEFMSVEESAATPVLVAAVDNDRMALLALKEYCRNSCPPRNGCGARAPVRPLFDAMRATQ